MRYFLKLAYNGKNYFGWQIQPKDISVQETIEKALSTILRNEISIIGAGRTDAGVHAKQMYAHFDFDENLPDDLAQRMNSFLPKDIVIYDILKVKDDAHARFDALERSYKYLISFGKNPFMQDFSWQINDYLDLNLMNEAAKFLIGKRDFSSFAKLHTDVKTHICDVKNAFWESSDEQFKFNISADRFLRNMVRAIVGTLVDVGRKKISVQDFKNIIEAKNRNSAGASAPAQGLFLTHIKYPKELFDE